MYSMIARMYAIIEYILAIIEWICSIIEWICAKSFRLTKSNQNIKTFNKLHTFILSLNHCVFGIEWTYSMYRAQWFSNRRIHLELISIGVSSVLRLLQGKQHTWCSCYVTIIHTTLLRQCKTRGMMVIWYKQQVHFFYH